MEALGALLETPGTFLEALGALLEALGTLLEALGTHLSRPKVHLGSPRGALEAQIGGQGAPSSASRASWKLQFGSQERPRAAEEQSKSSLGAKIASCRNHRFS